MSSSHNIKSSNALQTGVGQKKASNGYRCSIAKELSSLLGDTDTLKKFDKARSRLKDSPNSKVLITNYEQSLAKIQTETLGLYNRLSKQFKEWEKNYFMAHDKEPTMSDVSNSNKKELFDKVQKCKKYLKHWKISVH